MRPRSLFVSRTGGQDKPGIPGVPYKEHREYHRKSEGMIGVERFCPHCETFTDTETRRQRETYDVHGESTEVLANIVRCLRCGEDLFDPAIDGDNLSRAYVVYREKHGLLGPTEVKNLRSNYGLTQRGLATLLGWSPATINRYERTGVFQTAHNHTLLVLKDPVRARGLFGPRLVLLSPAERQRFEEAVDKSVPSSLPETIKATLEGQKPDEFTGYQRFDLAKLADMISFFAGDRGVFKTKLMKLLWYSDFLHFRSQAIGISGAIYVNLPNGPALDYWEFVLGTLERERLIEIHFEEREEWSGERIRGVTPVDSSRFEDSELEIMQLVQRHLGHLSASSLSNRSHMEVAWINTHRGQRISYRFANQLKLDFSPPLLGGE